MRNFQQHSIRVLIAKVGLDGHDRGALVVAQGLRDAGMEVYFTGIRKTPAQVAETAARLGADCLGLSSHTGTHLVHFPEVVRQLRDRKAQPLLLIGGGIIPEADVPLLLQTGFSVIFTPGTSVHTVAEFIRSRVYEKRKGLRVKPSYG